MPSPEEIDDSARPVEETPQQDPLPEPIVNNVNDSVHVVKCFRCGSIESLTLCRHCGNEFCSNHRSKYSDQYCYLCIAPDNLGLEFLPLESEEIDEETGNTVTHHGRRIKLIGEGWPNAMQMVNSFPDTEEGQKGLEIFIAERQRLLQEAIKTTEYHRITLSHAEFTKEYRRYSKAAKLQRRYSEIRQGVVRLSGKRHDVGAKARKQESEDEKLMKHYGINAEQLKALKKVLNKI
jgi:hypothetical protein